MKRIVLMLLALALASPAWAADAPKADQQDAPYRPQVAAHRGASAYLPEHTIPAKTMAYAMNPDFIEQDVVMTKDGVLMIMHDPDLDTTTDVAKKFPGRARENGKYYAIDFTWPEIETLTVTERFDPATGKPIFAGRFPVDTGIEFKVPKFEDELKLIQGLNKSTGKDIGVYVEVKEPEFHKQAGKDITGEVIKMLDKYGYNSPDANSILQIFSYDGVKDARAKGWKGDLAMLVIPGGQHLVDDKAVHDYLLTPEGIAEVSQYATIYAPWFSSLAVPSEDGQSYKVNDLADVARKNGMKVHSWTWRKDQPFKGFKNSDEALDVAFKKIKLDGMFADFPDEMIKYLQKEGLRK